MRSNRKGEPMTNAPMIDSAEDLDLSDVEVSGSDVISEAIAVIDRALSQLVRRELVSSVEVSDLLLDVRNVLGASAKNKN